MLKLNIYIIVVLLTVTKDNCQNKLLEDKIAIHKEVVSTLKRGKEKIVVYNYTKKSSFSSFDFAGGGKGLDTNSTRVWNKNAWSNFVKSIDTASLEEYPLNIPSKKNDKSKKLVFAPVIFSNNNDKALCIGKLYSVSGTSGSGIAWFFERENGQWTIKDMQVFLIIN